MNDNSGAMMCWLESRVTYVDQHAGVGHSRLLLELLDKVGLDIAGAGGAGGAGTAEERHCGWY